MKYLNRMGPVALAHLYGRMTLASDVKVDDFQVEEDKERGGLIVSYPEVAIELHTLKGKKVRVHYLVKDFEPPKCLDDLGDPSKDLYFKFMLDTFGKEYLEDYLKEKMHLDVDIPEITVRLG